MKNRILTSKKINEITAYHGTGSEFDEFSTEFMGTGAGSQAFGWGIYVTSSSKIGKSYAKTLGAASLFFRGQYVYNSKTDLNTYYHNPFRLIYDLFSNPQSNTPKKAYQMAKRFMGMCEGGIMYDTWLEVCNILKNSNKSDWKIKRKSNLIEVDIPDDNGHNYLYWDSPNDVSDELLNIIHKLSKDGEQDAYVYEIKNDYYGCFGGSIYGTLTNLTGSPQKASMVLKSIGYIGISYTAGTICGGAEFGDTNYVIFDPKNIKIIKKSSINEMMTYHGSLKNFDNFDSSYMGTGEGAQIYGWGHYVTSSPELGQFYALNAFLSNYSKERKNYYKYNGKKFYPTMEYQVEIPDDNCSNYIWWNENRNEILLWIIERLRGIVDDKILKVAYNGISNNNRIISNFKTFGSLYHFLSKKLKTPKNASLALSQAGFTGIKVYGGSNPSPLVGLIKRILNWPQNTKIINYVIFKDEDVKIVDKQSVDWRDTNKFSFDTNKGIGWKFVIKDPNKFIPNNKDAFTSDEL